MEGYYWGREENESDVSHAFLKEAASDVNESYLEFKNETLVAQWNLNTFYSA